MKEGTETLMLEADEVRLERKDDDNGSKAEGARRVSERARDAEEGDGDGEAASVMGEPRRRADHAGPERKDDENGEAKDPLVPAADEEKGKGSPTRSPRRGWSWLRSGMGARPGVSDASRGSGIGAAGGSGDLPVVREVDTAMVAAVFKQVRADVLKLVTEEYINLGEDLKLK